MSGATKKCAVAAVLFFSGAVLSPAIFASAAFIAKVNGTVISAQELQDEVDRLIPRATYHGNIPDGKRKEFKEKAVENLINAELIYQDAAARGYRTDSRKVKGELRKIRDRFKSEKDFRSALDRKGLSEGDLRRKIEKALVIREAINKMVEEPAVMSDSALKEYYDSNIARFKQPESVRLRIISMKDKDKAEELLARAKSGTDFGELAAVHSEDKYRIKGGDAGYIHRGMMIPELEEAAFKLKKGDISGLIHAQGIWYLFKVEDRQPEKQMEFHEVRAKIKKDMEKKKREKLRAEWIADLRSKSSIEIADLAIH